MEIHLVCKFIEYADEQEINTADQLVTCYASSVISVINHCQWNYSNYAAGGAVGSSCWHVPMVMHDYNATVCGAKAADLQEQEAERNTVPCKTIGTAKPVPLFLLYAENIWVWHQKMNMRQENSISAFISSYLHLDQWKNLEIASFVTQTPDL